MSQGDDILMDRVGKIASNGTPTITQSPNKVL